jgi:hypothetical protein
MKEKLKTPAKYRSTSMPHGHTGDVETYIEGYQPTISSWLSTKSDDLPSISIIGQIHLVATRDDHPSRVCILDKSGNTRPGLGPLVTHRKATWYKGIHLPCYCIASYNHRHLNLFGVHNHPGPQTRCSNEPVRTSHTARRTILRHASTTRSRVRQVRLPYCLHQVIRLFF